MNNKIKTTTTAHFDFFDRLKILFGRCVVLEVTFIPFDDDVELPPHTVVSSLEIVSKTKTRFAKEPEYGFVSQTDEINHFKQ